MAKFNCTTFLEPSIIATKSCAALEIFLNVKEQSEKCRCDMRDLVSGHGDWCWVDGWSG